MLNLSPKHNKIFKGLVIGLAVAAAAVLLKEVILEPGHISVSEMPIYAPEIKIDFALLESPGLEALNPLEEIVLPELFGRTYPFEEY